MLVRKMRKADSPMWAAMRFALWDDDSVGGHLVEITGMLKNRKFTGYIALSNGQPVGFAEIAIRDYANGCSSRPVAFLEGIWVDPRHRRAGVGRALIERITGDLIKRGFDEIGSDADIKNKRSHQAHAQWGFNETERVVCFRRSLRGDP